MKIQQGNFRMLANSDCRKCYWLAEVTFVRQEKIQPHVASSRMIVSRVERASLYQRWDPGEKVIREISEEGEIKTGESARFEKCEKYEKHVWIYDDRTIKLPYQPIFYELSEKRFLYYQAEFEQLHVVRTVIWL